MPLALSLALAALISATTADAAPNEDDHPAPLLLASFNTQGTSSTDRGAKDLISGTWQTVNDNIMGGRSQGSGQIRDGLMVFAGSINTNGGGFSSLRARNTQWDLTPYEGIAARIRADGRTYVFHIDTGLRSNNGNVFYRGSFTTDRLINANGEPITTEQSATDTPAWQDVFVPFDQFVPMVRGRDVTGRVEQLDPAKIQGLGLMIDDGQDGPFRLEADWLKAQPRPTLR